MSDGIIQQPTDTWQDLDELRQIADAPTFVWLAGADPATADGNVITDLEVGGKLVGRYSTTSKATGAEYFVYQLLNKAGRIIAVHAQRTVLKRELEVVPIGSALFIRYEGQVEREDAPSYHRYTVLHRAPGSVEPEPAEPPVEGE